MAQPTDILEFWFGKPGEERYGKPNPAWFGPAPEFDAEVRERFADDFERAAAGELSAWEATPEGALALILLLDQCPSILFRNQPRAFATDAAALQAAQRAIALGYDQRFPDACRAFFYLPFEHSEDREEQRRSVELFSALEPTPENKMGLDYALRHQRVIKRFGRFPNRNDALGRESTPEEREFLAGPDAPF